MIKVSVIMPVHNVEPYLRDCLDSVVKQTLKDIEIICVNDCSTDQSLDILKEYEARDSRIIVINNEAKQGAAKSRNLGMEYARGEYLAIIDSDDFCDLQMLEISYNRCAEYDADLGTYDYYKYNNITKSTFHLSFPLYFMREFEGSCFSFEQLNDQVFQLINCAPWNKLYKRVFVIESGFKFQDIKNCNDNFFGYMILTKAQKVIYIDTDKPLYYYRVNLQNQITSNVHWNPKCVLEALIAVKNSMKELGIFERYKRSFYSRAVDNFYYMFEKSEGNYRELYQLIQDEGLKELDMMDCGQENFISKYEYYRYLYLKNDEFDDRLKPNALFKNNELFHFLISAGYKYGLWGYGAFGKSFYHACHEHHLDLSCIIDEDITKLGLQVDGLAIQSFESASKIVNAVIVTNSQFSKDIYRVIRQSGREIKLIDIDSYLRLGLKIEECIF
ncbi:glycosyl transferase family 2 [Paenibacillus taihuensis]|uniref:Glycosyl transferase family 2 n=1 Tax=Paenibacillus taihuensis TaxID=1156355 RepID=A0A3D9S6Q1_9BACL|nr:glycosyltransferase family 2 protein [Paenibacillus taihuensis]REE84495.1 glycosyl transferase family 2 [Paenibacillus taihuensis]